MSSIDRLLVSGIRSFSPESRENVVEFYTPLTLIVGHNGAGKTTIIECLKFATTGELPPNSKGGAFINDPKLSNSTEVKAQVKLRFKNVNQHDMVVTRSLQLTRKAKTVTQKSLENVLLTRNPFTNETTSISAKCAEIDKEVPHNLGVSKAILESVIFCHQDEASWPFSEPSALKKRFDDIFASTRYTKALLAVKDLRKESQTEIVLDRQRLGHTDLEREKAAKVKDNLERTRRKIDLSKAKVATLNTQSEEISTQLSELEERIQKTERLRAKIDQLRHDLKNATSSSRELRSSMTPMDETDEELKEILREQKAKLSGAESIQSRLEAAKRTLEEELSRLRTQHGVKCTRRGQLIAEAENHKANLKDRERAVAELVKKYNLRGFNSDSLSTEDVNRFFEKFSVKEREQQMQIADMMAQNRENEVRLTSDIEAVGNQLASVNQTVKMKRDTLLEHGNRIKSLKIRMDKMADNEVNLDNAKRKLAEETELLEKSKSAFDAAKHEGELRKLEEERREVEFKLSKLNEESNSLNIMADIRAKLTLKKEEAARTNESLNRLIQTSKSEFEAVLGTFPSPEKLDVELNRALRSQEALLAELNERHVTLNNNLSSLDAQSTLSNDLLQKKTTDLEKGRKVLQAKCGDEELPEVLSKRKRELDESVETRAAAQYAKEFFRRVLAQKKVTHACDTCKRKFGGDEEEIKFEDMINQRIQNLPELLLEAESTEARLRAEVEELNKLYVVHSEMQELSTIFIPEMQKKLEGLRKQRASLRAEIENIASELGVQQSREKNMSLLKKRADDIPRLMRESSHLARDIQSLESELSLSGVIRTMDDIQREYDAAQARDKHVRREIERLNSFIKARQREIQTHQTNFHELREQVSQLSLALGDGLAIKNQIDDLQQQDSVLEREIQEASREAEGLQNKLRQLTENRLQKKKEFATIEADMQKEFSKLQADANRVRDMNRVIERYTQQGNVEMLQQSEQDIEKLASAIKEKERLLQKNMEEAAGQNRSLADMKVLERNIHDNIRLRELIRKEQDLQATIEKLIIEKNQMNVTGDSTALTQLRNQQNKVSDERSGLLGEIRQMEVQARQLDDELSTSYNDVDDNYQSQLIKLKTAELANQDLEKYGKALDSAIMKYHTLKMEEINKIIKELWGYTYRGNDIDTIAIRSDDDPESKVGNRSYNYRVVMIHDGIELDVRGRCSAGQKVLASIIIRLALAETFGLSCGMLALDEPTTNLDKANVESLADSLSRIIDSRRQQANFQLIIITHDDEFLHRLGKAEYCDYYWRVQKDDEGFSQIMKHSIVN